MINNHVIYLQKQNSCKITILMVSTFARNSGNCNLIGCYGYTCFYNPIIIIPIILILSITYTNKQNSILIKSF